MLHIDFHTHHIARVALGFLGKGSNFKIEDQKGGVRALAGLKSRATLCFARLSQVVWCNGMRWRLCGPISRWPVWTCLHCEHVVNFWVYDEEFIVEVQKVKIKGRASLGG